MDPACKIGYVSQFLQGDKKDTTVFEYIAQEFIKLEKAFQERKITEKLCLNCTFKNRFK